MKDKIEEVMDRWSDTIAKEIAERKLYNIDEVRAYASVRLKEAVKDCISIQANELEEKRVDLVKKVNAEGITHRTKTKIQAELVVINKKIKDREAVLYAADDWTPEQKRQNRERLGINSNGGANKITGRLTKVLPLESYKDKYSLSFVVAICYNSKVPFSNEANFAKFTLKNERITKINDFKVGDVISVEYVLSCDNFEGKNGTVYLHHLIPLSITKIDN